MPEDIPDSGKYRLDFLSRAAMRLEPERSLTERLDIAVAALQAICEEDGPKEGPVIGYDLPGGPCFRIAKEALHEIVVK